MEKEEIKKELDEVEKLLKEIQDSIKEQIRNLEIFCGVVCVICLGVFLYSLLPKETVIIKSEYIILVRMASLLCGIIFFVLLYYTELSDYYHKQFIPTIENYCNNFRNLPFLFKIGTKELWDVARKECILSLLLLVCLGISVVVFQKFWVSNLLYIISMIIVIVYVLKKNGRGYSGELVFATIGWFDIFAYIILMGYLIFHIIKASF